MPGERLPKAGVPARRDPGVERGEGRGQHRREDGEGHWEPSVPLKVNVDLGPNWAGAH